MPTRFRQSTRHAILLLAIVIGSSACVPVRTTSLEGSTRGQINRIESKGVISRRFGLPDASTTDGRFQLYSLRKDAEWWLIGQQDSTPFVTNDVGLTHVLVEFDAGNLALATRFFNCRYDSKEPLCSAPAEEIMWALVSELRGQETAQAFRDDERIHATLAGPIILAGANGDLAAIQNLLACGASLTSEVEGMTPLHQAASAGRIPVLEFLIDNGVPIDTGTARDSRTPLHLAAGAGDLEAIDWLVARGADIGGAGDGATPLMHAVVEGQTASARRLIESGAEVGAEPLEILVEAAKLGDPEMVALLIDHGADVNARESIFTAIFTAGSNAGTTIGSVSRHKPLYYAVRERHVEVADLLLSHGADVDAGRARDDVLHMAVEAGDIDMVGLLLEHQADPNRRVSTPRNSNYRNSGYRRITPIQRATLKQREDIVTLLERHGATG